MKNFIKSGRVVLVLNGRYAGRKAVITKASMSGTSSRPFPHVVVAGIDRYPRKITKSMNKAKVAKRSRIKPFIKVLNLNHVFPTRFTFDLKMKREDTSEEVLRTHKRRATVRRHLKEILEKKFATGENKFFFTKLRF
ncbi:60S ribosomal protein L27 [Thelohanellus kitauei]|uniref:Large ribosomal subunit protein eL27 n=1 Tax=Thelohanellus kitauei TaxID=669202 RepID=A0A0C2JA28_THEKT|nr:60S ribosomal protein L27 [Thelohanellus kitauei]